MELELGLQLLLQSLPAIAKIFTALHEERLRYLKQQKAKETQAFHSQVRPRKPQDNLDFHRWRFEQEKSLQQQLATDNRETQLTIASYQRETALQLPENHKILDNWPLRLFPSQLLGSRYNEQRIPLRIFISPPQLQLARLSEVAEALPEIEHNLAQSIGEFLSKNYALTSQERPTEFLAGAWESKRFHREASIKALFDRLKSEPTLILESELVGNYLNFRIAYWGLGQQTYCYQTIISKLDYRQILYASAKDRALKWKAIAEQLLACGESPEDVNRLGGDNSFNLAILEKEEKWKFYGIDTSELDLEYKVNNKDFEALSQLLITCHYLVVGWVADAHHLIHYDVSPLLPELLPSLLEKTSDQQLVQEVMQTTIFGYKDIFKALEIERPFWVPELALKLAQSLAGLPDKSWAKEQVDYSFNAWLKQRQVPQVTEANAVEAIVSALTIEDQSYLEKLKHCLTIIGEDSAMVASLSLRNVYGERDATRTRSPKEFSKSTAVGIARVDTLLSAIEHLKELGDERLGKGDSRRVKEDAGTHRTLPTNSPPPASHRDGVPLHYNPRTAPHYPIIPSSSSTNRSLVKVEKQGTLVPVSSALSKSKPSLEKASLIHTLTGHSGKAASIAVSCDGQMLASGGEDNTIQLWNLRTGELLHNLTGDWGRILTIALSPDGQILASSHKTSDKSCINIWHLGTGKLLHTLSGHNKWIYSLAMTPDSKILISGGYKIKVWDLDTGEPLCTLGGHKKWVYSLAISPDGQTLASCGGDKTVKIWQLETDKRVQESPLRNLTGHSDWVRTVAISFDGQILASGSDDSTIKLWHLPTGKLIRTLTGHSDWVLSLAMTPDGQTLISGSRDNTIKLWHLETGTLLRTLTEHKKWVYSLAVTPDGHTLASGSEDKTVKIWQAV